MRNPFKLSQIRIITGLSRPYLNRHMKTPKTKSTSLRLETTCRGNKWSTATRTTHKQATSCTAVGCFCCFSNFDGVMLTRAWLVRTRMCMRFRLLDKYACFVFLSERTGKIHGEEKTQERKCSVWCFDFFCWGDLKMKYICAGGVLLIVPCWCWQLCPSLLQLRRWIPLGSRPPYTPWYACDCRGVHGEVMRGEGSSSSSSSNSEGSGDSWELRGVSFTSMDSRKKRHEKPGFNPNWKITCTRKIDGFKS